MAVIRTHNSTVLAPTVSTNGTQYVDGALNISAAVTIVLSAAVYSTGGYYVLFDWSGGGSFTGNVSNITIDSSGLSNVSFNSVIYDPANSRILLSLDQDKADSVQYVDGTLSFTGATTVTLNSDLFGSEGVYTLFDWSGGGAFSGTIGNLTVTALKSGLTAGTPYIDGSTIKVRLLRS
jgi:hypothetical protein